MSLRRWWFLTAYVGLGVLASACETTTEIRNNPSGGADERVITTTTRPEPPDNARRARVRLELAAAYFSRGQLPVALEEVNQAILADANLGTAYNLRGLIQAGMGETDLAEQSYRRALQINPRDGDTMHNLGWFYCQQRRYDDGDALFSQALAQPQYAGGSRSMLARGVCQARAGQWMQAEGTLTRAYELDPGNAATAVNLAEVLLRRGDAERAQFYIRRVNSQPDQSNAQTLWLASRIEMKLGNRQAAEDLGRQLRERFPQAPETLAYQKGQFNE